MGTLPSAQKPRRTGLHSLSGQPGLGLSSLEEGGGTCHAGDRERISSGARRRLTDLKVLEMIAVAALSAHSGPDTLLPAAHNPRTQQLEGAPCCAIHGMEPKAARPHPSWSHSQSVVAGSQPLPGSRPLLALSHSLFHPSSPGCRVFTKPPGRT